MLVFLFLGFSSSYTFGGAVLLLIDVILMIVHGIMPNTDYKQQYLDICGKLELREKQFAEKSSMLMDVVLSLSDIADYGDESLEKRLKTLRSLFKKGSIARADLVTVANSLKADVKRQEAMNKQRGQLMQDVFKALSEHIKQQDLNSEAKQELKQFNKIIKRDIPLALAPAVLKNYSALHMQAFSSSQSQQSQGFFDRIFSRKGEGEVSATGGEEEQALAEESTVEQELLVVEEEPASQSFDLSLFDQVAEPLRSLIRQIDPPPPAKKEYQQVSKNLAEGLNDGNLVPTIENACHLILATLAQLQEEFQQFLEQLNSRLSEADQLVIESIQSQQEGFDSGRTMQSEVREQMQAIEQSMDSVNDLSNLKLQVKDRLDNMLGSLDRHQSGEQQRELQLTEKLEQMQQKIVLMEQQAQHAEKLLAEQRRLAMVDTLTQLPNRAAYEERLAFEFNRWNRYKSPLTMVVSDIDFFKKINDTYGHQAGDKVLRLIAKTISQRLRKTDFIARFGGEEFVCLLPETDNQKAFSVMEVIRKVIAGAPFKFNDQPVKVTISFGIAQFKEGETADQVFDRADKALYMAKEQGRNCCIIN